MIHTYEVSFELIINKNKTFTLIDVTSVKVYCTQWKCVITF